METSTLEPTTERLLIYQSEVEINRIIQETETRANLLNEILSFGIIKNEEIKTVTRSEDSVQPYIFNEQLKTNKVMQTQHKAGKRIQFGEYSLPVNLDFLMHALLAWVRYPYPKGADKFQHLIFTTRWEVDGEALERLFIQRQLKIYLSGEKLLEYNEVKSLCGYLEKYKAPNNQVAQNSFFSSRIECVGQHKFEPRWQNFRTDR